MKPTPLACPRCQCKWVPSLYTRSGRCNALDKASNTAFAKWHELTKTFATLESLYRQRPMSMLFELPAPDPRTNIFPGNALRISNRVYSVPPSSVEDEATFNSDSGRAPDFPLCPENDTLTPKYDRRVWRKLGDSFRSLDMTIQAAWQGWFPIVARSCRRGDHRGIVLANFCVSRDQLTVQEAAAIGWACTWLGIHLLAPKEALAMPSLGLLSWLAHLPERPLDTSRSDWLSQVEKWLQADLLKSHRLWQTIATDMHNQGSYLLLGAFVPTKAFARKHEPEMAID